MTGIERLRKLSEDMLILSLWARLASGTEKDWDCWEYDDKTLDSTLADIADQIKRESDVEIVRSDAMEAWEWVREHGGLERVKWLLDWCLSHDSKIEQLDFDFWLSGRVMHELGFEGDMADRDEVERRLLARLMPEGCEWPRYESGELVEVGDGVSVTVHDEDGDFERTMAAESVSFDGHGVIISDPCHVVRLLSGERVRRPESKCRDCAHWQKDPTADKMGVCWFFYHEHEGQDCYPARLGDIGACEEFMPRARALAERDR